ncbi:sugar ABC transporter permease [Kamptonema cortianum]|nr:sugar ABC transporter permease [Geitlerinema splendidum]MDK3155328.1 sugar ABC transporter permease [Kamptonema cortianum]
MRVRSGKAARTGFLLTCIVPSLAIYIALLVVPFLQTIQLSLYRFSGVSSKKQFVGFANFQKLWIEEPFWWALRNSVVLLFVVAPVIIILSLLLAHASTGESRRAKILRAVYLIPNIISVVAVAGIWRAVYFPNQGLLAGLGFSGPGEGFLGSTKLAFLCFSIAYIWVSLGFYTMLFSAALKSIPSEITEAANLEGVSAWQMFKCISWPMMWSVRRMAVVHLAISAMSVFALVNVMTVGGPSNRTQTMLNYLYELQFQQGESGLASAVGVVNVLLMVIVSMTIWTAFRKNPQESAR